MTTKPVHAPTPVSSLPLLVLLHRLSPILCPRSCFSSFHSEHREKPAFRLATTTLAWLLLLLSLAATTTAPAAPPPHKKPAPHKSIVKSTHHTATKATHSNKSRQMATVHSRFSSRHLVHVDPISHLDAISAIASTLSRGDTAITLPAALDRFFAALAEHQQDPSTSTVRILQFGDSHTAADMFTGEARRVLQRQFGNGSVGFTYPGHPFAGYRILGSQRSQSGGWQTLGTHFSDLGDTLLGMDGVALTTSRPGEFVTLDAPCTSLQLDFLGQPGGGSVIVSDNGTPITTLSTDNPTNTPGSFHYTCPESKAEDAHHFVVTTASTAPVRLFGLTTLEPGVTWESIGINGAVAPLILRWDQTLFTTYLRDTAANLVVLAYGTNEAAARSDPEIYSLAFTRLIETIHTHLPNASVLVLGPTDRATAAHHRGFAPFSGTAPILEAQRAVCRAHDCAFWNQQGRMGGLGSMGRWVYAGWAQPDHTHFTGEGYRALADALMADLLSGYDSYRKAHNLPLSDLPGHATATGTSTSPPSLSSTPTQQP